MLETKYCSTCGESYTGYHLCRDALKSNYERGYDEGRDALLGHFEKPKFCTSCGKVDFGSHICIDLSKTEYERGYDAGRNSAMRELGFAGVGSFCFSGE